MTQQYTIKEAVDILDDLIEVNYQNKQNKLSRSNIAMAIEGSHGIGKSESIVDYGLENNYATHVLECAQIDDVTLLLGYPRQTYKVNKTVNVTLDDNTVKEKTIVRHILVNEIDKYINDGWTQVTFNPELTYSKPGWLSKLESTKKSILFLDELNRALPFIQNAVMNLINNGGYSTWQLPKHCTVVIAMNPNDGDYNVSGFDPASLDRFMIYKVKANKEAWVEWATKKNINENCINYIYHVPEATEDPSGDSNNSNVPSFRKWTKFFLSINNKDFNNKSDINKIYRNGVGSIGHAHVKSFVNFIENNLDLIPSLKWVFDKKTLSAVAISALQTACYDKTTNVVRSDIKGLITLRLKSYIRTRPSSEMNDDFIMKMIQLFTQNVLPVDAIITLITDILSTNNPHPHRKKLEEKFISNNKIGDIIMKNNII